MFDIKITIKKFFKYGIIYLIPQLGAILSSMTAAINDASVLAFLQKNYPALDPALSILISSIFVAILNAVKVILQDRRKFEA